MPELIDVLLDSLQEGSVYSVIFPLGVNEEHEAYTAEFLHYDYDEYLFAIRGISSNAETASKDIGDQFSIPIGKQTTDIHDRTKYMVLEEQYIPFPPELEDAHTDPNTDQEINRILDERGMDDESSRTRMLRVLMMGHRPSRSPLLRSAQNSPFVGSRSHTPAGGRRRRTRNERANTRRKRKNKRKNKTRRTMPRKSKRKNKNKSNRRSRKRGGSRTHTPINSPEMSRVAQVMNLVLSGLAIQYRDGWNWNAGTGGWLRLGNPDSVSDSPPFPDIILNVLNRNVEEAEATLVELGHSDQGAIPRTNVVNAILPTSQVTPLMLAVYLRDVHMVRFLVQNGADISHTIEILSDNDHGPPVRTSALDMAYILNNDDYHPDEIVRYLQQNQRNNYDSEQFQ